METMRRLRKEEEDGTRFTDLPGSLQLHIFSSLETKHAVQTLMLLKSCSWTSIPVLTFNSSVRMDFLTFSSSVTMDYQTLRDFDRFVYNVLSRREPAKLEKLSFKRGGTCGSKILIKVLDYALLHGVRELKMDIAYGGKCIHWPFSLHASSESVTNLKLVSRNSYMNCVILGRSTGLFKNLTNLQLKRVIIKDPDPFSRFLALDKLTLIHCPVNTNGIVLKIHAQRLSELTISNDSHQLVNRYELTTPKLRYFEYRGANFRQLTTHQGGFPILETAVLDYNVCCRQHEMIVSDDVLMMFNTLSKAKSLTVSSSFVYLLLKFLDALVSQCSPFRELKCLKLDFSLFYTQHLFRSWRESMKLLPLVKGYFLQNSKDAQCTIIHPKSGHPIPINGYY